MQNGFGLRVPVSKHYLLLGVRWERLLELESLICLDVNASDVTLGLLNPSCSPSAISEF